MTELAYYQSKKTTSRNKMWLLCNLVQKAARPVVTSTAADDTIQAGLFVSDELMKQEDVVSNAKMYS